MKPELANECEKGLNMINKAVKGDYCITGDVSTYLYRYANLIQAAAEKLQNAKMVLSIEENNVMALILVDKHV